MPLYNTADSPYMHKGLRAMCDIPANVPLYHESAVAYVPTILFRIPRKGSERDGADRVPGTRVPLGSFSTVPITDEELQKHVAEKDAFFRQGWPIISPLLIDLPNGALLQLVCSLILKNPGLALDYGAPTGTPSAFPNKYPDELIPFEPDFCCAMKTLVFFGCPKKHLRPWLKVEDFSRLYNCVRSNVLDCATLITSTRYGAGLYPVIGRANHSCDPNCIRITAPNGCYLGNRIQNRTS